jgi:hypothetical protein
MSLFWCSWWAGERACGAEAVRVIVDSEVPDRHVCAEHYMMWRQFITRKETVLCP